MTILGIDPGLQGAFCIRMDDSVILEQMPVKDKALDLPELNRLLRHYADQIVHAYLEMQSMRPRQTGQFKIGRGFGNIEGMLACLGITTHIIRPQVWSDAYDHGVTEVDISKRYNLIKKSRARIAQDLYPGINLKRTAACKQPDSGLVDAMLIADYGYKKHKQRKDSE